MHENLIRKLLDAVKHRHVKYLVCFYKEFSTSMLEKDDLVKSPENFHQSLLIRKDIYRCGVFTEMIKVMRLKEGSKKKGKFFFHIKIDLFEDNNVVLCSVYIDAFFDVLYVVAKDEKFFIYLTDSNRDFLSERYKNRFI